MMKKNHLISDQCFDSLAIRNRLLRLCFIKGNICLFEKKIIISENEYKTIGGFESMTEKPHIELRISEIEH